ncbi:MAG: glycosyltransferase family 39 protein, partial [Alphaproteobacteria bacterium]|nr:glycosyltransferase family 39 protein [Alphaproteobacteria bacterium]
MQSALVRLEAKPLVLFVLLLVFALAIRAITFGNPILGVDDQFYLLVGDQMVHHGAIPYVTIFDRKPVGLFLIYAAIRELGGDGFVEYKLVACLFVASGGLLIYRAARPISSALGAFVAALIYMLWLGFMEGEGGQSPVFYNPLMIGAALLTWASVEKASRRRALGALAMLCVGLALQIKYTVVFEGIFFGLVLMWGQWRDAKSLGRTLGAGAFWAGIALLPTALAMSYYWHIGALHEFLFANFYSVFGRAYLHQSYTLLLAGSAAIVLAPLIVLALVAVREGKLTPRWVFYFGWLAVSIFALVAFGSFLDKHYALPVIAPVSLLVAPYFGRDEARAHFAARFIAIALLLNQLSLNATAYLLGGRAEAQTLATAAQPKHGCLYVASDYPALYMMTHSCLLTKWIFPAHLRDRKETSLSALGVDPVAELGRVLAQRPETIVDTRSDSDEDNPASRRLLYGVLAQDYHAVQRV